MILKKVKEAENYWRNIVRLATPLDSDKKVHIGTKPKQGDFEAYTDDKEIWINVDEKKFRKNFENIILPPYHPFMDTLYDLKGAVSKKEESLENLVLDTFLFVHFHEQLHPWLCPNSKTDRKKITKALYEGIKKAEPSLPKAKVMMKVNNCKNLIWDTVLNTSFLSKTGDKKDQLYDKISFVFKKKDRKIVSELLKKFPKGILPTIYIMSANNHTTDTPISLIGSFYTSLSFNEPNLREKAMDYFIKDLQSKKISGTQAKSLLKKMFEGFVSELPDSKLKSRGIDKTQYLQNTRLVTDLRNSAYVSNQEYFIANLTNIFDSLDLRYDSLKGFIQVLSPYISLSQKQGSPDPNSSGSGGSGGEGSDGKGSESGDENGKGSGDEKSQEEMDKDSMSSTLDDLLDELDEKEADDLLEDMANGGGGTGRGYGIGGPGTYSRKKISIVGADEYYKKNADVLEVKNASEEMQTFDIGDKQVWKLIRSNTLTQTQVCKLNHQQIINFQKRTGLPVLVDVGRGFFKVNEYRLESRPQKSYTFSKTGIEIPDNWVLFQDSSGSMTGLQYVGSKNKFDILNRVKYGLHKGLYQVCKDLSKDLNFGIVDFSDRTIYKGLDSLIKLYECKYHPIKVVSLCPQCGGTTFNSSLFKSVEKDLRPGKSIYAFITDGGIGGDTTSLYNEIKKFAKIPGNCFVYVAIGSGGTFGQDMKSLSKKSKSVLHYTVSNIKSIKDKLGSVLIQYN